MYDYLENRGPPGNSQGPHAENMPPSDSPHRRSPRREEGWERDDWGRAGGRGKKGRGRKKFPEEWVMLQDPPQPAPGLGFHAQQMAAAETLEPSLADTHPQAMMDTSGPSVQDPLLSLVDDSLPLDLDDGLVPSMPPSLSQDLLSLTASFPPSTMTSDPAPAGPTAVSPVLGTGSSPKETPHPQSPGMENSFPAGGTGTPVAPLIAAGSLTPGKAEEGLSLLPSDLFATDTPPSTDSEALPPSPKGEQTSGMPNQKGTPVPESSAPRPLKEDAPVPSSPPPSKESPLLTPIYLQTEPPTDKTVPAPVSSESPNEGDVHVTSKDSPLVPVEGELAPPVQPSDNKDPLPHADSVTPESPPPAGEPEDPSLLHRTPSPRERKEAPGQKRKQPKKSRPASAKSPTSPEEKQPSSQTSPVLSPSAPSPPAPSSLSPLAAPFPAPNWELNPTAVPFFPNLSELQEGPPGPEGVVDLSTAEGL